MEDLNSSSFSNFSLRKKHYVTVGRPVGEVNRAEKLTNPGRIVMSPNAWDLCDKNRLVGEQLPNRFFELKFLKDSRKLSPLTFKRTRPSLFTSQPEDDGVLRKSMTLNPDHNGIYDTLKDYVSPIVQEKLLDQQPLRYLSELRQVTVVFINLSFRQKLQDKRFYQKQAPYIQRAFAICEFEMSKLGGSVNKLFMFDKGCSILACFGLPGSKHDSEAAHALESSLFIKERMKAEISALEKVSIGVTTGPVFVGVMGHKQRHEYTIIGPKVNID